MQGPLPVFLELANYCSGVDRNAREGRACQIFRGTMYQNVEKQNTGYLKINEWL
jgi:hypothetical protein